MKLQIVIRILLLPLLIAIITTQASATIFEVGDAKEYSSIQTAVNDAIEGDKIIVYGGTYNENVILDKRLILEGVDDPVIDASGNGNPISIYAGNSVVDGFILRNGRSGLYLLSDNNVLINNTLENNQYGIYLFRS